METVESKCLIVDDSKIVRKVTRKILEGIGGFDISEAENGQEALAMCQISMPQLIMLDWHMPVMTGIDFLTALRQSPGGGAPVVIFCTTETDMARIGEAMERGANEYVMKPFDEAIIKGKLQQLEII